MGCPCLFCVDCIEVRRTGVTGQAGEGLEDIKGEQKKTCPSKKRFWLWRENRLSWEAVLLTDCSPHEYYKL